MFLYFFSLVFAISLLRNVLFWLSYVQRKQYRVDRIWVSLQQPTFWKLIASPYRLALLFLFLSWQLGVRYAQSGRLFDVLTVLSAAVFAAQAGLTIRHALKGTIERPVFTPKIALFGAAVLGLNLLLLRIAWYGTPYLLSLHVISPEHAITLEFIQPFLVIGLFFILFQPNALLQRRQIRLATEKRRSLKKLRVVGITGSVGKTSMKEFVSHILSATGRVTSTKNHVNVDTGVAKQVLAELDDSYAWYIVEMGAYKVGEIKSICDMVAPEYGILTALGNQHVELFGSHEKLRDAKFELVDAVKEPNNLFMNAGSERLRQACETKSIRPHWYGLHPLAELKPEQVVFSESNITFELAGQPFEIPGFGTARLINALGAISFCRHVGMPMPVIAETCRTLPVVEQNMQVLRGSHDCLVIDSTYNASVTGVLQAIEDLARVPQEKKVIIFREVIELGPDAESDHIKIADAIADAKARALLLPSAWSEVMTERLLSRGVDKTLLLTPQAFHEMPLDAQTVVLGLGRDAQPYISAIV